MGKLQQTSESGMFFVVRDGLLPSMSKDPKPVSERLITLRFPLVNNRYCTLITTYILTMTNTPEKISSFYDQFDQILHAILNANKIVLLRDFNAWVGQSHYWWQKILSKLRTGKANTNGCHPFAQNIIKRESRRFVKVLNTIIKGETWKSLQTGRMPNQSPSSKWETDKTVATTAGSCFSPYWGKSSLAYCSTDDQS